MIVIFKVRSVKKWFSEFGVEELGSTASKTVWCKVSPGPHSFSCIMTDRQTTSDHAVISHMQPNPVGLGQIIADRPKLPESWQR